MHSLLVLASIVLMVLGSYLALGLLDRLRDWSQRRHVQLFVLASPLGSLGLGICLFSIPSWDSLLGIVLVAGTGVFAIGAIGLGVIRLVLMTRVITGSGAFASPELQMLADSLAQQLNTAPSAVLLCVYDRPLALTCGIFRPTVLLSTWMVEHLDRRELEAVLAHELQHVARRDYLVIWLATLLRDAFFYLPTSQVAYRQLQHEKELACDDLAIGATQRPLALASALAKVWQHAVDRLQFVGYSIAQPLVGVGESISGRIERLLTAPRSENSTYSSRKVVRSTNVWVFIGLVIVEVANLTLVLASMGCNPLALLWKAL